jgi:hypothetical protein
LSGAERKLLAFVAALAFVAVLACVAVLWADAVADGMGGKNSFLLSAVVGDSTMGDIAPRMTDEDESSGLPTLPSTVAKRPWPGPGAVERELRSASPLALAAACMSLAEEDWRRGRCGVRAGVGVATSAKESASVGLGGSTTRETERGRRAALSERCTTDSEGEGGTTWTSRPPSDEFTEAELGWGEGARVEAVVVLMREWDCEVRTGEGLRDRSDEFRDGLANGDLLTNLLRKLGAMVGGFGERECGMIYRRNASVGAASTMTSVDTVLTYLFSPRSTWILDDLGVLDKTSTRQGDCADEKLWAPVQTASALCAKQNHASSGCRVAPFRLRSCLAQSAIQHWGSWYFCQLSMLVSREDCQTTCCGDSPKLFHFSRVSQHAIVVAIFACICPKPQHCNVHNDVLYTEGIIFHKTAPRRLFRPACLV